MQRRRMSFWATWPCILDRSQTVTRRLGWKDLEQGEELWAVERYKRQVRLAEPEGRLIKVVSIQQEHLDAITLQEVAAEGYPGLSTSGFVAMYCEQHLCPRVAIVQRIEFQHMGKELPRQLALLPEDPGE